MNGHQFTVLKDVTLPHEPPASPKDYNVGAHIDVALGAIEMSLQRQALLHPLEQNVSGLALPTIEEQNLRLLKSKYLLREGTWDNWEANLCPGYASDLHDVMKSKQLIHLYQRELQNSSPLDWGFVDQVQSTSFWGVGNHNFFWQFNKKLNLNGDLYVEVLKVTGVTIKKPFNDLEFVPGSKERVSSEAKQTLGDMTLESGLFVKEAPPPKNKPELNLRTRRTTVLL